MSRNRPLINRSPDIRGMQDFVADRDREDPLAFVGRSHEIAEINQVVGRVAAGKTKGLTQIITGAPGAGKTALLGELKKRWANNTPGQPPLAVELPAAVFETPPEAISMVLDAMDPVKAREIGAVITETTTGELGVAAGIKAGGSRARSVQYGRPVEWLGRLAGMYPDWTRPIVLMVDEAQNMRADHQEDGRTLNRLLEEIHQGNHGLPLLLIAAGLGNTVDRLEDMGLSRPAGRSTHRLGRLSYGECSEATQRIFGRFRVQGDEAARRTWIEAIIRSSDGWPHHLQNNLQGACMALAEAGGDLGRASLEKAMQEGAAARLEYYDRRLGPLRKAGSAVHAAIQALDGERGASYGDLEAAVHAGLQAEAAKRPGVMKRWDSDIVMSSMIHRGIIQEHEQGRYQCPIPSMRQYILDTCAPSGPCQEERGTPRTYWPM